MPRLTDRNQIRKTLNLDPNWAVYPLGDLRADLFPACQWHRPIGGRDACLALVMRGFTPAILWANATPAELADILREIDDDELFLQIRTDQLAPVAEAGFAISHQREMSRMSLDPVRFAAADWRPAGAQLPPLERLTASRDAAALEALYADGQEAAESPEFFYPEMVDSGVFYGLRDESGLIAAAGTHLVNAEEGVAAIGNVYTRRDWRGRGSARFLTGAVTAELWSAGCRVICLNVRTGNAPARRAYERLGFVEHCVYYEARGRRSPGPLPTGSAC